MEETHIKSQERGAPQSTAPWRDAETGDMGFQGSKEEGLEQDGQCGQGRLCWISAFREPPFQYELVRQRVSDSDRSSGEKGGRERIGSIAWEGCSFRESG